MSGTVFETDFTWDDTASSISPTKPEELVRPRFHETVSVICNHVFPLTVSISFLIHNAICSVSVSPTFIPFDYSFMHQTYIEHFLCTRGHDGAP